MTFVAGAERAEGPMPSRPPTHRPHGISSKQKRQRASDQRRGSSTARGYDYAWQKLRDRKLRADYLCASCKSQGRATLACEVDHVIRISEAPGLRLDWDNLQSLCHPCHAVKSGAERAADRGA